MFDTKINVVQYSTLPYKLNDDGAKALAAAIIVQAAKDYHSVCLKLPDNHSRGELERFIDSDWYETLTDIPRSAFRETIQRMKRTGQKIVLDFRTYKGDKK